MLPAGKHVAATFLGESGLLAQLPAGSLVLDASTIDAETAKQVAAEATRSPYRLHGYTRFRWCSGSCGGHASIYVRWLS